MTSLIFLWKNGTNAAKGKFLAAGYGGKEHGYPIQEINCESHCPMIE